VAVRSVCAASLAPAQTEEFLADVGGASQLFAAATGDASLWPRLCARSDLRALAEDARRLIPSRALLDAAAPDLTSPWRELRAAR
jgi:hypothetical protein